MSFSPTSILGANEAETSANSLLSFFGSWEGSGYLREGQVVRFRVPSDSRALDKMVAPDQNCRTKQKTKNEVRLCGSSLFVRGLRRVPQKMGWPVFTCSSRGCGGTAGRPSQTCPECEDRGRGQVSQRPQRWSVMLRLWLRSLYSCLSARIQLEHLSRKGKYAL